MITTTIESTKLLYDNVCNTLLKSKRKGGKEREEKKEKLPLSKIAKHTSRLDNKKQKKILLQKYTN